MKTTVLLSLLLSFVVCLPLSAQDQTPQLSTESTLVIPSKISYQGILTDDIGNPLTGTFTMQFGLYLAATGGTPLWTETQSVPVNNGVFNVMLGSVSPITLVFDVPYWLSITVSGSVLSPRIELGSSPYSMRARTLEDTPTPVVFTSLNNTAATVSSTPTQLGIGTRTFTKQHASTRIELVLYSRMGAGTFAGGATNIRYELRVDGNATLYGTEHVIFTSGATEYVTLHATFTGLATGTRTVSVWARTNAGTSSSVIVDPGGWGGKIIVRETF